MAHVLMVIAPEMFRDEEYQYPKQVLEDRGASVVTASVWTGTCRGKLGATAEATLSLRDVNPSDYTAVVFVGGSGATVLFDDPNALSLAQLAFHSGAIVAAICIAPSVLAHAGLLEGVHATAFASQKDDLIEHGAIWSTNSVEVDGRIITANGPEVARDFGVAIAGAIGI